jgi:hypothetical protein
MAFMYLIDKAQRLLFVRMEGTIRADDIFALLKAIAADPDLEPRLNYLGDYHAAVLEQISPPVIFGLSVIVQRLVDQFRPPLGHVIRQAVVVSEGNSTSVRDLHGAALSGLRERQFFSDLGAACAWLGLPGDWIPPAFPPP